PGRHAAMDSVPQLTTDAAGNPKPRGRTRFQPGQSGNPKGKPRGAKNRVLLALIGIDTVLPVKRYIWISSILLSVSTCSLQSRTRRAVARGPAALLDLRCARRSTRRQIGTAE